MRDGRSSGIHELLTHRSFMERLHQALQLLQSQVDHAELQSRAADMDALCGGLGDVPDLGLNRVAATPTAKAAALFVARLPDGDLPRPRPVYVREPDATPMRPVGQ